VYESLLLVCRDACIFATSACTDATSPPSEAAAGNGTASIASIPQMIVAFKARLFPALKLLHHQLRPDRMNPEITNSESVERFSLLIALGLPRPFLACFSTAAARGGARLYRTHTCSSIKMSHAAS
jgi:hypothetical protein